MVSIDSAKLSTLPHATMCQVEKMRSATWHSGRYVTMRSCWFGRLAAGQCARAGVTILSMAKAALALVSIAPFGGPVVPDV